MKIPPKVSKKYKSGFEVFIPKRGTITLSIRGAIKGAAIPAPNT